MAFILRRTFPNLSVCRPALTAFYTEATPYSVLNRERFGPTLSYYDHDQPLDLVWLESISLWHILWNETDRWARLYDVCGTHSSNHQTPA